MVVGQTGTGKSVFLRSLVFQSVQDGAALLLSDLDGTTFSTLQDHPSVLADIASTPAGAGNLVSVALAECDRRAALYSAAENYPEHGGGRGAR
jgi:DNA segregation ATPase FtsK/SpoIIIE-like protein